LPLTDGGGWRVDLINQKKNRSNRKSGDPKDRRKRVLILSGNEDKQVSNDKSGEKG